MKAGKTKAVKKQHCACSEKLKKVSVALEEEQIVILEAMAKEYKEKLGQRWSLGAMVRVAVGDFLTRMGKFS